MLLKVMKNIILTSLLLVIGGAIIYTSILATQLPLGAPPAFINIPKQNSVDTPKVLPVTLTSVRGKKALFIGDSHTAADYGWQHQVCKQTGMTYSNTAVGGQQTAWMVGVAQTKVTEYFDYCFIYGGANDMAGNRPPMKSVKNIQKIVNICNQHQVTPVVITGFDPKTCINVGTRKAYQGYPQRYARFQQMLVDSIQNAIVVKTHCISRTDCGDFLCHMTSSGHKKMAECVIEKLQLKKL